MEGKKIDRVVKLEDYSLETLLGVGKLTLI